MHLHTIIPEFTFFLIITESLRDILEFSILIIYAFGRQRYHSGYRKQIKFIENLSLFML
jgi:hypothetical protein